MKPRSVTKFAAALAISTSLAIGSVSPAHAISRPLGASDSTTIKDAAISSEVVLAHGDNLSYQDESLDEAKAASSSGATKSLGQLLAIVGTLLSQSMQTSTSLSSAASNF